MKSLLSLSFVALAFAAGAALKVEEAKDGSFSLYRDGKLVVAGLGPVMDREVKSESSFVTRPDGSRVWNRWNESAGDRYRFELAERADGHIEITMLGYSNGKLENRTRSVRFGLPAAVYGGKPYEARSQYRLYSGGSKGEFKPDFKEFKTRYLASEGMVFNLDAISLGTHTNPGTRTGICGTWTVKPDGQGGVLVTSDAMLPKDSNAEAGSKLIIHEGTYADHAIDHHLPSFNIYWDRMFPQYLVKFGAPKAGADYTDGNCPFEKKYGWVGATAQKTVACNRSGAYYSHACGKGRATYRFAKLAPGYFIITCQLGNYNGEKNDFSITVNGEPLAKGVSVKKREARTIARTFHITGGTADVVFDGDWLVSAIGVQPILADEEDFCMARGFWFTDGFEPSIVRQNAYSRPFNPSTLDQTMAMPEPGAETAARFRDPPRPVELVDMSKPSNQWMYELSMRNAQLGSAEYYADDAKREAFAAESEKLHYNAFMLHGCIDRHDMGEGFLERLHEGLDKFTESAHRHGLKFIDHVDVTLVWANMYGFRTFIERLDTAMLDFNDNLPTYLLCFENPIWKDYFYKYLRSRMEKGADGFQLDELTYWKHGCGCGHCRAKFAAETGWFFPLDETDPSVKYGAKTELGQRWREWQAANITNWRIGLRRYTKDVNPDLYMSTYGTYGSQTGRGAGIGAFFEAARTMSMFGTEVMQQDVMRCARPLLPLARIKNILRVAYGVPSWNWYYNSNYANECFAFGVSSMTGEVPLLTGSWLGADYDPAFGNPLEWSAVSRPMKLAGCEPVAKVGLLYSCNSCKYNEGDDFLPELMGLAQELECAHIPYEFIGDESCVYEQLKKYRVFFLGAAQCLSDAEIAALRTFGVRGGKVYGRPGCGSRDERGVERKEKFDAFAVVESAKPFYEEEGPVRHEDKAPRLKCERGAQLAYRAELVKLVGDAAWWRLEGAPEKLYTSVFREADDSLVLHFLNATGCDLWDEKGFVHLKSKARYPELREDVFVTLPRTVAGNPVALSPEFGKEERPLESVRLPDGRLRIRLPKEYLQVYTIMRMW